MRDQPSSAAFSRFRDSVCAAHLHTKASSQEGVADELA